MSQVRREVYIDGKQADVNPDSVAGYIFSSPIFRDISKIFDNRTTTYILPPTNHNLKIVGLVNEPGANPQFPYKPHAFEEWHNGVLFIKGECYFLQYSEKGIEFSVFWGNSTKMQVLKDKKLRGMKSGMFALWNDGVSYLNSTSTASVGFLAIDYGKGIGNMKYARPAIRLKGTGANNPGIIDLIEKDMGIKIKYPSGFDERFNQTWIPLLDNNADKLTWEFDYSVTVKITSSIVNNFIMKVENGNSSLIKDSSAIVVKDAKAYKVEGNFTIGFDSKTAPKDILNLKLRIILTAGNVNRDFDIIKGSDGNYYAECSLNEQIELEGESTGLIKFVFVDSKGRNSTAWKSGFLPSPIELKIQVQPEKVKYKDSFPIVPNLPDLTVVEFLKNLMNMFGLYTYYKSTDSEETIEFVSVDDIYANIASAYDCTHKLIAGDSGRYRVKTQYEDWAQQNWLRYTYDKEAEKVDADGCIEIADKTIAVQKDLFTLAFSPSLNELDDEGFSYAKIPLFEDGDEPQSLKYRILLEGVYTEDIEKGTKYLTAHFPDEYRFGGEEGLLNEHYSAVRHVMRQPVVLSVRMKFNSAELSTFSEVRPKIEL